MKAMQVHTKTAVYSVREVAGMTVVTVVKGKLAGRVFKCRLPPQPQIGKPFAFACVQSGQVITTTDVVAIQEA